MVYFVGAGPGAADLITMRGKALLETADTVIYAGSLINPALLGYCRAGCALHDSARLTLPKIIALMEQTERAGGQTVRLHSGDPSIYGAIREQMDALTERGVAYEICPGVASFCAAAAALRAEYTLPSASQTIILTRMAGKTPAPEKQSIESLAAHGATMVVFLSAGMPNELRAALLRGGYRADTPAAIVYKAGWPEEIVLRGTVDTLPQLANSHSITKTALIAVGDFLGDAYTPSKLYDPQFSTGYRKATE
ncbi:MAG: precorrin-4 C(11)-methyltransferase [Clostridiales bacterium]|jgi:precorrin-4/cobalt-precorrin-4 C11-methyltransferase|nr:precorrin-4 C(11)-methyltransferase [Clostridiales bacterium]